MKPILAAAGMLVVGGATLLAATPSPVCAPVQPGVVHLDAPTTQPSAKPQNKTCPVTGDDVDPTVPTVLYQGHIVGFCCTDCLKEFKAHPEKYAANLKF